MSQQKKHEFSEVAGNSRRVVLMNNNMSYIQFVVVVVAAANLNFDSKVNNSEIKRK